MQIGKRTAWHLPSTNHWELRRFQTLAGYEPPLRRPELLAFEVELQQPMNIQFAIPWYKYVSSCSEQLRLRFAFYRSIHSSYYSRTSHNFSMTAIDDYTVGAHASPADKTTIFLNKGSVYAMEEVCHLLLAFPCTLLSSLMRPTQEEYSRNHVFVHALRARLATFLGDYTSGVRTRGDDLIRFDFWNPADSREFAFLRGLRFPLLPQIMCTISADVSRQMIADNLSVLATQWLISHEDAHRYLGHLRFFDASLGASGNDGRPTFDELVAGYTDPELARKRVSAELDADSMAAMRMVDSTFDAEFLGMFSDYLPPHIQAEIWQGANEAGGLKEPQRLFLLRLACAACVIPLLVFQVNIDRSGEANASSYPTFLTRAINTIFMIASRAMDVALSHPEYGVGPLSLDEVERFIQEAIIDLRCFADVVRLASAGLNPRVSPRVLHDTTAIDGQFGRELFFVYLIYHGQVGVLGLNNKLALRRCSNEELLRDFIVTKLASHDHAEHDFAAARLVENAHRPEIVAQNIMANRARGSFWKQWIEL